MSLLERLQEKIEGRELAKNLLNSINEMVSELKTINNKLDKILTALDRITEDEGRKDRK